MRLVANFCCVGGQRLPVAELLGAVTDKTPDEIAKTIATTGIRALRVAADKRLSAFVDASLARIVERAPSLRGGVDAIVVVSQTYDQALPSISTRVQAALGCASDTFCIDVNDGCAGFVKATQLAHWLTTAGGRKKVLVVAGDLNTKMTAGADVATRVLFGDGLSYSVFEASADPCDAVLFNDGAHAEHIGCANGGDAAMRMNGFEVFRFTRNVVPGLVRDHLGRRGLAADAYDLIGFHQASALIVKTLSAATGLSNQRDGAVDFGCGEIGNLGAGSIGAWLAVQPELPRGAPLRMLAIGYGAGLSWGLADFQVCIESHNEVLECP